MHKLVLNPIGLYVPCLLLVSAADVPDTLTQFPPTGTPDSGIPHQY